MLVEDLQHSPDYMGQRGLAHAALSEDHRVQPNLGYCVIDLLKLTPSPREQRFRADGSAWRESRAGVGCENLRVFGRKGVHHARSVAATASSRHRTVTLQ